MDNHDHDMTRKPYYINVILIINAYFAVQVISRSGNSKRVSYISVFKQEQDSFPIHTLEFPATIMCGGGFI